jgi:hypothetical protein
MLPAINGDLSVLQRAREDECVWNRYTFAAAATCGHLSILKWARENGCEWDCSFVLLLLVVVMRGQMGFPG